ncbi:hypothetical protein Tco_1562242 [Tanacetum coccineum]
MRNERLSLSIKVIELLLPGLTDLQSELHFTNDPLPILWLYLNKLLIYRSLVECPKDDVPFPFGNIIYYLKHENVKVVTNAKEKEEDRVRQCVASSLNIVLIKTFRDIEATPMHLDQPINVWLVVEVGVALEVVRVKGHLTIHNVVEVVQQVVVGEEGVTPLNFPTAED